MKNLETVRKALQEQNPNDAKLEKCDGYYICNKYLVNNRARNEFARKLGFESRCDICCDNCNGSDAMTRYSPRCRGGLLRWLESEP